MNLRARCNAIALVAIAVCVLAVLPTARALEVGMATADITPAVDGSQPVWMAGQENNRRATGVHDPLNARALVLRDGATKIALVSLDVIGVQLPTVEQIRAKLKEFAYVLVASTHNHEGPDVVGLWGPSPGESGVDSGYLENLVAKTVAVVREADTATRPAHARYGSAGERKLLKDFRLPEVYDDVLRCVRFQDDQGRNCGLLVQWNSHPVEPDGNHELTRDFMGVTVDALEKKYDCKVIYFSGAVGGLMGTPTEPFLNAEGKLPVKSAFDFIRLYGEAVAELTVRAVESAKPIELTPIRFAARPVAVRLDNPGYRQARKAGVLSRPAFEWTGDAENLGPELPTDKVDGDQASESEVACLRLGELNIAAIPGELYPELVYGEMPAKAEPEADYPDAKPEQAVMSLLPRERTLLIGLANDEVGYIIPKRQWDVAKPFCYRKTSPQYGERNSMGPETAAILLDALARRVKEIDQP